MSEKPAEQSPDIDKLPNFAALETWLATNLPYGFDRAKLTAWIAKLEEWCSESLYAREELTMKVTELQETVDQARSEAEDAEETLRTGIETVLDFSRSIRDPGEVVTWARENEGRLTPDKETTSVSDR